MNQQQDNERMNDVHYKALKITRGTDKPDPGFVFISYKSDSWKVVLSEIVYKLQNTYGLRVYFDKDFSNGTDGWIDQFTDNMDSPACKAFLCFIDDKYVTSYATLLELMHAMNGSSNLNDRLSSQVQQNQQKNL